MVETRWILDELPLAVWVGSAPDGAITYANKAFEHILPHSASAQFGPGAPSLTEQASLSYALVDREYNPYPVGQLPFARVLATGTPAVVDDLVVRRDGRDTFLRAFGSPVFAADGSVSHVIIALSDITAEVSSKRERAQLEERLRFICNHAPISLWATDIEGTITLSEGAALASLGVKPGQLVGGNIFQMYADHPTIPDHFRRALAGDSFWYTAQSGEVVFESWLTSLRDESGKMIGLAGFSNDVSQVRKLQHTVIQSDRVNALGTLASSVAHEINNPLTFVLAHADGVTDELDALEGLLGGLEESRVTSVRACIERLRAEFAPIRSGVARIATITRDLRSFSRPDDTSVSEVNPRSVVESVVRLVGKEVESRARLVLELNDTPPVVGNEARLAQVFHNLIVNAFQAVPSGAAGQHEVSIRSYCKDSKVVVEVSDTGPGVPEAERERIFEPFSSTKAIGAGTGLGLFVCRNIVRALHGDVQVSSGPGGGALFRVTLPAGSAAPLSVPPPALTNPQPTAGRHIVLIDDDAMVLRALSSKLTRNGFRVTAFGDAESGIEFLLTANDVDLVYCDLMMPGMTGMDLASVLAEKAPELTARLVFMTGGAFSPKAQDFVAQHRVTMVGKPFDILTETHSRLG